NKPKSKKKRGSSGAYPGMGGRGAFGEGSSEKKSQLEALKEKKEKEREKSRLKGALAGEVDTAKKKADEDPAEEEPAGEQKKALKGIRWAVLLGEIDHKALRDNYAKALKVDLAAANPHYLRLDVERQEQDDDGAWP